MTLLECILVLLAGFAAGTINAIVGSGTLITFPVLLALGYSPVVANVSNNLGLVPGAASSAVAYREELRGRGRQLLRYAPATASGAICICPNSPCWNGIAPMLLMTRSWLIPSW